uniref:NADH dehydrogenase subunit 4 n=1 Tax=Periconia digitata TaxID=1303443 RepID=UPI0023AA3207|nr:NADH dehydrogenase subunit 4 [Periconia digitata]WCA44854.1 NADH dehydrogenase subunit 4 [Periconia digitata]
MLLSSLLLIPLLGVFAILVTKDNMATKYNIQANNNRDSYSKNEGTSPDGTTSDGTARDGTTTEGSSAEDSRTDDSIGNPYPSNNSLSLTYVKVIGLTTSIINLFISLIIFILFDFSTNQFQFVQEYHEISFFDFYLGVDGISVYFILLTTFIIPISILSNWTSISKDVESYVMIILLLETLLLAVFLVLDILLFYIFFESILPPLFILIGIFGSDNRVKASFYLFLYTLLGSLFLLLSILAMSSIMSTTDFDTLFKGNFLYITQLFLFYGIFIAFAVKTPTIFLNTWLLKAHVESPLGGSIILAAIVLKLSLYGILRLILPVLPKAYMEYTYVIYLIGVITIIYASLSTLRTIDVKELIAYSSVSHAAVYLLAVFSNSIQGIEGGITLGLAHGLVSPGLFICAGGILYDRSHTRLIAFYRGMAQIMPLFAILFFILCLSNCGAPLSLNFIGEFLSLYGVFERSSFFGVFASSSIVFSAAYTMYMYQKIAFGGAYSRLIAFNFSDVNMREYYVLLTLVVPTILFGIYTAPILDGLHYSVSTLIYNFDINTIGCDSPQSKLNLHR